MPLSEISCLRCAAICSLLIVREEIITCFYLTTLSSSGVWLPFQISRDRRLLPIFHQNAWSCRFWVSKGVPSGIAVLRKALPRPSAWPRQEPAGGVSPRFLFEASVVLNTKGTSQLCAAPSFAPDLPTTGFSRRRNRPRPGLLRPPAIPTPCLRAYGK